MYRCDCRFAKYAIVDFDLANPCYEKEQSENGRKEEDSTMEKWEEKKGNLDARWKTTRKRTTSARRKTTPMVPYVLPPPPQGCQLADLTIGRMNPASHFRCHRTWTMPALFP
jgi:hypothetical protein